MSSFQFCGKKWFNKATKVHFEFFVRETNCCVFTAVVVIAKKTCPTAMQDV